MSCLWLSMILYYNGITKNNLKISIGFRMWVITSNVFKLFQTYIYTNIAEIHKFLQNKLFKYYWFVFLDHDMQMIVVILLFLPNSSSDLELFVY